MIINKNIEYVLTSKEGHFFHIESRKIAKSYRKMYKNNPIWSIWARLIINKVTYRRLLNRKG